MLRNAKFLCNCSSTLFPENCVLIAENMGTVTTCVFLSQTLTVHFEEGRSSISDFTLRASIEITVCSVCHLLVLLQSKRVHLNHRYRILIVCPLLSLTKFPSDGLWDEMSLPNRFEYRLSYCIDTWIN